MKLFNHVVIFVLSIFILSCSGGSESDISRSSSGTTTVTLNVGQQSGSARSAPIAVPAEVTDMDCRVSGSDMSVINAPIDISSNTAIVEVPSGPGRHFEIFAYDAGGALIYFGEITADLFGSSAALSITMNPVSNNGLQGTWNLHSIISGDLPPEWPGWEHGQGNINSSGILVFNDFLCSDGTTALPGNMTINVAPDNKVTIPEEPTFGGFINTANDLIVGTADHEDGGYELVLAQKAGSGFALADLAGDWRAHGISTGDAPAVPRWTHTDVTIDAFGDMSFTNLVRNGVPQGPQAATVLLSPDGIVTVPAAPLAHGVINIGKDLVVWTDTDTGSTNLFISQRTGGTFTQGDLSGTWNMFSIVSGDSPQWRGWERGQVNIDALGNLTELAYLDSDGNTSSAGGGGAFTLAPNGVITESSGSFDGFMNLGKDFVVGTTFDDDGGYKLILMQKTSDDFFAGPTQLTFDGGNDYYPVWDPAGSTIAFLTNRAPSDGSNLNIGMVQADATGEGNMATGANTPLALGWSLSWVGSTGLLMTNERIVFHEYLAFDTSVTLPFNRVVSDGNDAAFTRKLQTPGGGGGDLIQVSRDGSTAVWQNRVGCCTSWTLYSAPYASLSGQAANAVGGSTAQWTTGTDPSWSVRGVAVAPDGSQFVIPQPSGSGTDLFIGNLVYTQLTTSGGTSGEINDHPDISPDGNWVAFRNNNDLWKINVDGTGLTQITNDGLSQGWPTWSPDGSRLAYHQYDTDNWNIWVMSVP